MIKISVIITVYNGEKYLEECLNSVIKQTLKEIEIICVDDGSDDRTPVILERYEKIDYRIKILTNENTCGAGISRNIGLEAAKGKYIIFLDADDYFDGDMLRQAYNRAESNTADICIFKENSFIDNHNGERVFTDYPYTKEIIKELGKKDYFFPMEIKDVLFNLWNGWAWDKLFRRDFILDRKLRFQEIKTSNDAFFVHAAMASAEKITFIDAIFVHHRVDILSSLSSIRDYSWECCYQYLQNLKRYLMEKNIYKIYEKSFINWSANFLYWNFWTLNETNRKNFFTALKEYMLNEFDFSNYSERFFYNKFDYWFIRRVYESNTYEESEIPIDAIARWKNLLQINNKKLEEVFQYLRNNKYNSAVWGVGQRGTIFLDEYGNREEIKKVYDKDLKKCGKKIKEKCMVETFNSVTCEGIDFIFVMSSLYFKEITEKVKKTKNQIKVFDIQSYLEPYLSFPISFESCIL